jgi:type IV secretion system protein VirB10
LIPEGSRLLGQYKSGMLQGQSRIFMVWTRLITPSGISIQIGSPGVDSLGMAGMGADAIDRHFWERFGTGSLLSLIGAGAANAGVTPADQENSASVYRSAVANSFSQSASQSLQQDSRIPPTLTTYQGKPIIVFVAKDLNFKGAIKQAIPRTNVF